MGNLADDTDTLDTTLKENGMDLIAPQRSTRKLKNQDRHRLRCYARQWLEKRFFAWLQWKCRLLVHWEYYASNFLTLCNWYPSPYSTSDFEHQHLP